MDSVPDCIIALTFYALWAMFLVLSVGAARVHQVVTGKTEVTGFTAGVPHGAGRLLAAQPRPYEHHRESADLRNRRAGRRGGGRGGCDLQHAGHRRGVRARGAIADPYCVGHGGGDKPAIYRVCGADCLPDVDGMADFAGRGRVLIHALGAYNTAMNVDRFDPTESFTPEEMASVRARSDVTGLLCVAHAWVVIAASMALYATVAQSADIHRGGDPDRLAAIGACDPDARCSPWRV